MATQLKYQQGFGHHFQSEAITGALPEGQNSPQNVPLGLYAEQINGTAFTAPRANNARSWLYRIRPSVLHGEFEPYTKPHYLPSSDPMHITPQQMRWAPIDIPSEPTDFIDGRIRMADNGHLELHCGNAIFHYGINKSMVNRYFYNADGEFLIAPQEGQLLFKTEMGQLQVAPGEICVIPRGIKFQVELMDKQARGYLCENYGQRLRLPELGPIGANGLANPRDFLSPIASYEDQEETAELFCKFHHRLWKATLKHSPLDVVAWHGNYAPYKYDLRLFNTINTVSFDHPDPSIFTVLTSPSQHEGIANLDFVIFSDRWMVAENTFRPPYFHRNIMNEYMGSIHGVYDAKSEGFAPGGSSLHNCMSAHGPDTDTYEKAIKADLKPQKYKNTLSIMFESCYVWRPTEFAITTAFRQKDYTDCWEGLTAHFNKEG